MLAHLRKGSNTFYFVFLSFFKQFYGLQLFVELKTKENNAPKEPNGWGEHELNWSDFLVNLEQIEVFENQTYS